MNSASEDLQFDTVTLRDHPPGSACGNCQTTLDGEYFDVNGHPVCRGCSETLAAHGQTPRGVGTLGRAAAMGVGAAILGAILYFAVLAITGFEVGLIAIAIGYMVGYGVKMGTRGRGGRRFQVLALVLTYWSVGLAYSSFAIKEAVQQNGRDSAATTAQAAPTEPTAAVSPQSDAPGDGQAGENADGSSLTVALASLLAFTFALPVLVVFSSLPGSIISAAIIAFGMMQAWRMTAAPAITVTGPFRIASAQPPPLPPTLPAN